MYEFSQSFPQSLNSVFFLFINVKLCKYNVYIDHNDWGILVQLLLLVWEKNNIILEETLPSCVTPPPPTAPPQAQGHNDTSV